MPTYLIIIESLWGGFEEEEGIWEIDRPNKAENPSYNSFCVPPNDTYTLQDLLLMMWRVCLSANSLSLSDRSSSSIKCEAKEEKKSKMGERERCWRVLERAVKREEAVCLDSFFSSLLSRVVVSSSWQLSSNEAVSLLPFLFSFDNNRLRGYNSDAS